MDVRIGISQSARELEVELADGVDRDALLKEIDAVLKSTDAVLSLTDKRGRQIAVPAGRIAYIEVGAAVDSRRVGFGAP